MIKNGMRTVHPGEILLEEFMKPSTPPINANMLAKAIDVPANRITAILKDEDGFGRQLQRAEFDYLVSSRAAQTVLAENYVGLTSAS